jgi:hypothetical protein
VTYAGTLDRGALWELVPLAPQPASKRISPTASSVLVVVIASAGYAMLK